MPSYKNAMDIMYYIEREKERERELKFGEWSINIIFNGPQNIKFIN